MPESAPPLDPPQPRLGIIHLMAWTLGSALILALQRALDQKNGAAFANMQFAYHAVAALSAFARGAALGGLLLWVKRKLLGGAPFPVAPGHWLLLIGGVLAAIEALGYGIMVTVQRWQERDFLNLNAYLTLQWIVYLMGTVLLLLAYYFSRHTHWRVVFGGMAGMEFLLLGLAVVALIQVATSRFGWGGIWLFYLGRILITLNGLLAIVGVIGDGISRTRRDWLHWTGLATCLSSVVLTWLWALLSHLAMPR